MVDQEPLSLAQLTTVMSDGAKPKDQWRIGTEHEKFGFNRNTLRRPAFWPC